MLNRRCIVTLAAVLSLGSIALTPGCDWLKASGSTERSSPFLSSLSISPSSVLCGPEHKFSVSFTYDDPQGDISQVQVVVQREGGIAVLTEPALWPEGQNRGSGNAVIPLSFSCETAGGSWSVTVQVVDDRGHISNSLTGTINLNNAG